MRTINISILVLAFALSACSTSPTFSGAPPAAVPVTLPAETPASTSPTTIVSENTEMSPTLPPPTLAGGSTENTDEARQDLARRLGMNAEDITVSAVIGQEFSVDAFYCQSSKDRIPRDAPPESISGLVILLRAGEHRYEYHASEQEVIYCRLIP